MTFGKDDWYFLISTVLAILALLGVDWKLFYGRLRMPSAFRKVLLLVAITGSLVMSGTGWYRLHHQDCRKFQDLSQQLIYGREFINEKVEIDGKRYENCTFTNVTFVYHGTGSFSFVNNSFHGARGIETDSDAVATTFLLLRGLKMEGVPVLLPDSQGHYKVKQMD